MRLADVRRAPAAAALALLVGAAAPAYATDAVAIQRFVAGLRSEAEECTFLRQLCAGAVASLEREATTPPGADVLASRQGGIAAARVQDARTAAGAIERKRGRRLACFDEAVCRRVLPRAEP